VGSLITLDTEEDHESRVGEQFDEAFAVGFGHRANLEASGQHPFIVPPAGLPAATS